MNRPAPGRSRDAGWDAHRAAVAHLEKCAEAMFAEEDSDGLAEVVSPAVGPYCGCTDCDVRETLAVAWPILLADAAAIAKLAGHDAAAELLHAEVLRVESCLALPRHDTQPERAEARRCHACHRELPAPGQAGDRWPAAIRRGPSDQRARPPRAETAAVIVDVAGRDQTTRRPPRPSPTETSVKDRLTGRAVVNERERGLHRAVTQFLRDQTRRAHLEERTGNAD